MSVVEGEPTAVRRPSWCFAAGLPLFGGSCAVTLLGFLARWWTLAEMSTHFLVFFAGSSLAAALLFCAGRRWGWAVASAALLVWQASAIVPWYLPADASQAHGPVLKVMTANANADNVKYERLLSVIAAEKPDLIFVQEVSIGWGAALKALDADYPYQVVDARTDYFGIALLSKYPIEHADSRDPVDSDAPLIRADVLIDGRRVHVVGAHLAPSRSAWMTRLRYKQFAWMNEYLPSVDGPLIVAGDFNTTMWSPLYHDLVQSGKLVNARRGHGLLPSWFPVTGSWHLIPIDHVFGGGGVRFTGAHLSGVIASDHRPLVAELRLPE